MILASSRGDVVRVALLHGDELREFYLWDRARPDGVGDVFTGRIEAVMPALAGSFVALGGPTGFLPDSAAGTPRPSLGTYADFRVTRAAQGGKGPRLTLVGAASADRPGLVARGPGPLLDLAARLPEQHILADDYSLIADLRPALGARIGHEANGVDAVLEDEIAALAEPTFALPGGGRAHVTPTPAATLIDIDSAAATQALAALNLSILPELCRQILLRNLSGGILIDFAGLKPAARRKLGPPLSAALAADPLQPTFLGISHLGFAELSRRRIRPPLHEILHR